ncbi:CpsD/CapB family tyrosine-protein kinase [Jhaorihella thermophila]|uniref:Chromosome partitioning ATPase, Mrp family, contains Fe-S cluster n=1 Tax=Jhaorihella thermophila TaxID=488547 RepID=A0A1H5TFH3_9RHOB|nr:CpsD/CapB family tyrosine-protein kinase [Jhaorihella thermophila]SEF61513.1 Chromosome partitioning ATPase, Mrp family, contains Fe-S cluster [Jhaorihella thermophila]
MRDFGIADEPHAGGKGASHGGAVDDGSDMKGPQFKHFRRGVAAGRVRDGSASVPALRNLPATIDDDWTGLQQTPAAGRRRFWSRRPLVNLHRDDPAARSFDLLRTRLLQVLRENGWRRMAVTAPRSGNGATFTAVNLALSLARIPRSRTLLIDLNLRAPGIASILGVAPTGDMPKFLAGELTVRDQFLRMGDTLALALASGPDRDAAERLHDRRSVASVDRAVAALRPDVTVIDLPPMLEHDDATAFMPQVDGVLLVADATQTTAEDIASCERLIDGQAALLGVVLNRARRSE